MIGSPLVHDRRPSPNTGPRRDGRQIDMLVLHYTGMESAEAACSWLCDPESGVSSHYLIDCGGRVTQMVGEDLRAWHAGASFWRGEADTNSRSIGIEIDNRGHTLGYTDFPTPQMDAVIALCRDILTRHAIPPRNVVAHSDVAPGRKIDPGELFDWRRLHAEGIGHWVAPRAQGVGVALDPKHVSALQALLATYGYSAPETGIADAETRKTIDAFQRHFRPGLVDGLADVSTFETLRDLVGSLSPTASG